MSYFPETMQGRMYVPAPGGQEKVLLHSCCAPCSGEVIEAMMVSGIDLTIYFYNPNIHPREEYDFRKEDNIKFAQKSGHPVYRRGLRQLQLVRPDQGHGDGAGKRHTLHRVFRHAV